MKFLKINNININEWIETKIRSNYGIIGLGIERLHETLNKTNLTNRNYYVHGISAGGR